MIVVCVFAKPPRPGTAKTRLAAHVGDARAAELARAFLLDTWSAVSELPWAEPVLASSEPLAANVPELAGAREWLQGGGDLGARQERIFRRALGSHEAVIGIGSDTPGMPQRLFERARALLATHDAVIGPADDGGYALIGLRRCPEGLFADLPWSTFETFTKLRGRLEARGLTVATIASWFDVDTEADLVRLESLLESGEIAAPRTRRVLGGRARISVIVPVLNEEQRIVQHLHAVRALAGIAEILVIDGGSRDRTRARAESVDGVRVCGAPRGRALQMNEGARIASGDVLLFLHADVRLPADAANWIERAFSDPSVVAGAFRTWTEPDGGRRWLGPLLHLADLRSRFSGLPYGDQALFVRASEFRNVGGFPVQPLMEDFELSRRLRARGKICTVPARVRVSGRRFQARPVYYTMLVNLFPWLYRVGAPASVLGRLYSDVR